MTDDSGTAQTQLIERETMQAVMRRLVYFILVLWIVSSIDRVNISFAALQMNAELGFSHREYGLGAAMFFVTYLLFQIPCALAGRRLGVRQSMGAMLIIWGCAATGMAFMRDTTSFVALRLVLGLAEAGFAPLTLYYYSCWIPGKWRGVATSKNTVAIAISIMIGAALSGWLISSFDKVAGLSGWQWMFLIEGVVPVLLGVFTLWYLPNHPREARWLTPVQRDWLTTELDRDAGNPDAHNISTLPAVATSWRVWVCVVAWFSLTMGIYGVIFWLPQAIKQFSGLSPFAVGMLTAVPWLGAAIGMIVNARHSDRTRERVWHVVIPALAGALGLSASASIANGPVAYVFLLLGLIGLGAAQAVFWTIPMSFMTGAAAAGGFAFINVCGNSAGLVGPNLIAWLRESTGTFSSAAYLLAAVLVLGAAFLTLLRKNPPPIPR